MFAGRSGAMRNSRLCFGETLMSRSASLAHAASSARAARKSLPMMPARDASDLGDRDDTELVSSGRLLHLFDDASDDFGASLGTAGPDDFRDLAIEVEHVHLFED
jgi:hypothetical protein